MYYYEVLVGALSYHGDVPLTYSSDLRLSVGQILRVPLRSKNVFGLVLRSVQKPEFDVKPIIAVADMSTVPLKSMDLLNWIKAYYPATLGSVVRLFTPPADTTNSFLNKSPGEILIDNDKVTLPDISSEQREALGAIAGPGTFLLHGITGSGKSRVYLELTLRTLQERKSAIILTPEIGLTAQLTKTFSVTLGQKVFAIHSKLTVAQRRNIWFELLARTEPSIVIGPRSALFSPLDNLGLIVIDESHDSAYKNESAPHYHANRVGAKLASLHNATLVLGSATPSVEDYYLAELRHRPIINMHQLCRLL